MRTREFLEFIQKAYHFDVAKDDGKVVFFQRNSSVAATIYYSELIIRDPKRGAIVDTGLAQEGELPSQIQISYLTEASPHEMAADASRLLSKGSRQLETMDMAPLLLSPERARRAVDRELLERWTNARSRKFCTGLKYMWLRVGKNINLQLHNGTFARVRLVDKNWVDGYIEWEAVDHDAVLYVSTGANATASQAGANQQVVSALGSSEILLLDIPPLRDIDVNPVMYVAKATMGETQAPARVYKSLDQVTYEPLTSIIPSATIGYTSTLLPAWDGGNMVDEKNTVTVTLIYGTLTSCTWDQLFQNFNVCVIGDEVIQFRTATLVTAGVYTLSGLLRARLGTEAAMSTHTTYDKFALLESTTIGATSLAVSDIGNVRYYKALTVGSTQNIEDVETHTVTPVGAFYKPLPPSNVAGIWNASTNDVVINWTRRARYNHFMNNGFGVPLDEATEAYELEICNPAGTVLRSIPSSSITVNGNGGTYTYTSANHTTDFGSIQPDIRVKVYQISATAGIGRGRVTDTTITKFLGSNTETFDADIGQIEYSNGVSWSVSGGCLRGPIGTNSGFCRLAPSCLPHAQDFDITFAFVWGSSFIDQAFIWRTNPNYPWTALGELGYYLRWNSNLQLFRGQNVAGGSSTTSLATVVTAPVTNGGVMRIVHVGSSIKVYSNGALLMNVTDSTHTGIGAFGMHAGSTSFYNTLKGLDNITLRK